MDKVHYCLLLLLVTAIFVQNTNARARNRPFQELEPSTSRNENSLGEGLFTTAMLKKLVALRSSFTSTTSKGPTKTTTKIVPTFPTATTSLVTPTAPSNPTAPTSLNTPTTPTNPTAPTSPTTPTAPTAPTANSSPTNPPLPTTQTDPINPPNPTTPNRPTSPTLNPTTNVVTTPTHRLGISNNSDDAEDFYSESDTTKGQADPSVPFKLIKKVPKNKLQKKAPLYRRQQLKRQKIQKEEQKKEEDEQRLHEAIDEAIELVRSQLHQQRMRHRQQQNHQLQVKYPKSRITTMNNPSSNVTS